MNLQDLMNRTRRYNPPRQRFPQRGGFIPGYPVPAPDPGRLPEQQRTPRGGFVPGYPVPQQPDPRRGQGMIGGMGQMQWNDWLSQRQPNMQPYQPQIPPEQELYPMPWLRQNRSGLQMYGR